MNNPYAAARGRPLVEESERSATINSDVARKRPPSAGITSDAAVDRSSATTTSRHLDEILCKLRPFQREAFDFATKGTISTRQFNESSAESSTEKQPAKLKPSVSSKSNYDSTLLGKGRILLADEMGTGKTITSLAIMTAYMDEWPLLILCPASLRHTWPAEIEKFLPSLPPSAVYVVSGFDDADFYVNENKLKRIKIVVATYSLLQNRSAAARVLQQFQFQCVIADESHNLKEKSSQRCKLGMPLLQQAKRLVLLSGTPALARPVELWAQVHCIAPKLFGSYTAFTKQYCNARRGRFGWDVSGLSNADELHQKLRQIMVRRLKSDVLSELPPKQRSIVPVKIDAEKDNECRELMKEMKDARVSVELLAGDDAREAHFEARRLLMMGYQASGIGKAKAVAEYLLDWLAGSGTQKILVFAHHKEVMDTLEQAISKKLKGTGHIRIDGSVSASDRALRVRKFQTSSNIRVAILSMTAAGVGLTLTAASSVLFAELHWTPGVLAQAEDRCHRIGQRNSVSVLYCVCDDAGVSVDRSLWTMLSRKVGNLGKVIDGCKDASMNVGDAEGVAVRKSTGESAEDELVRFFAESSSGEKKAPIRQEPVKGSIMSFFKPAASFAQAASSATQAPTSRPQMKASSKKSPAGQTVGGMALPAAADGSKAEVVEWSCETCTFDNKREKPRSGYLACEMCATPFIETLDDTSDDEVEDNVRLPPMLSSSTQESSASNDLIVIDSDSDDDNVNAPETIGIDGDAPLSLSAVTPSARKAKRARVEGKAQESDQSILHFGVSANSGRVLFHLAATGESLCSGVDIEGILTEETNDAILSSAVARHASTSKTTAKVGIRFNDAAVLKAIQALPTSRLDDSERQCCDELKAFVTAYMSLRQVEKEALKSSGKAVSSFGFHQTVARIMTESADTPPSTTERYSGGAKEQAEKRRQEGTATIEDYAVLAGKACAWCANTLPRTSLAENVEATYCSQTCVEQGRLRRGGMYASSRVRAQVFGLEGGVCQHCGIDAHALFLRISALHPAERLNALCNANWRLPTGNVALERLLQNPKEGDFWQADHITAVAEGGGSCGLDNLRTLCTPCHKVETDKLRARLRLGTKNEDSTSNGPKQTDIRSSFAPRSSRTCSADSAASDDRKRPADNL